MLEGVARTYSTVFAPEFFVLSCGLLVLATEWSRKPDRSNRGLGARLGVVALGWIVGLAVYRGVPLLVGPVPKWIDDSLGTVGLVVGFAAIWAVWRLRAWGRLVPAFAGLLLAVSVPHLLITPFWDVSSHVLYTAVPAGALAWLDSRFAVLAAVPTGMVVARPLAGVHTWPQSLAGLALGAVAVFAFARVATVRPSRKSGRAKSSTVDADAPGDP